MSAGAACPCLAPHDGACLFLEPDEVRSAWWPVPTSVLPVQSVLSSRAR